MAKGKKNKLEGMKQTHGALMTAPATIEDLTGLTDTYSVSSLDQYKELLAKMTDDDMQQHAVDVAGIVPVTIRSVLISRLESKFIETVGRKNIPMVGPTKMSAADQEFQRKFFA